MKKTIMVLLVGILALVSFSGCGSQKAGKVVAKVGDRAITVDDLEAQWADASRMIIRNVSEFDRKKDLVNKLVGDQVVILEGYKQGIDNEVENDSGFAKQKEGLLLNVLYKKEIADKAQATESEMKQEYEKTQQEIHAWHILVETEEQADSIYKALKGGADFATLAKGKSIDPSAKDNGGDLGFFRWGRMVPEFQDAAFKLKDGEISKPVKTTYGWHVIKVVERRKVEQSPYEDAKKMIQARLEQTKREQRVKEYFKELKDKAGFKADEKALAMVMSKKQEIPPDTLGLKRSGDYLDSNQFTPDQQTMPLFTYQGGAVTVIEFIRQFSEIPQPYRPRLSDAEKIGEIGFQNLTKQLLVDTAKKQNLEKSQEFAKEWNSLKEKEMVKRMTNEVILKGVGISDDELQGYYDRHKDRFTVQPQVQVKEILVKTPDEAQSILKQLKKGADFAKLAQEKTIRSYAKDSGGDLGTFARQRYPELFDAATGMAKGSLGGPIKVADKQFGEAYSVIKLIDKTEGKVQPLDEVKDRLIPMARREKDTSVYMQWVQNTQARYKVEVFDEVIKSTIKEAAPDTTKKG
ncbi:MAG: peptidylprolyl isomerase [Candidatus Zixiibacteriota bacterium]